MAGRTLRARMLGCPNCGAKLRLDRDAPVIECRYCQTHVVVQTGRRTDQPTDVISRAAPPTLKIILAVSALTLVAGGISIAMMGRNARSTTATAAPNTTSTVATLIATPLAAGPEAVAAHHGVKVAHTGRNVRVLISDGPFKEAGFHWEEGALDHVDSISLWPRHEGAKLDDVVARARAQLGRRLRGAATGGYQFHAKGVSLSISTTVQIHANANGSPAWQAELAVLWTVLKHAALGADETIDDRARRDVLNLAYPLTVLNEIAFDTVVDDAARELHRVAPGADSQGERHTIGFDHPWFETASLGWKNEAGGKWSSVILYFPAELDFKATADAISACVAPVLGEPNRMVSDHLAGTFRLQFRAKGGRPWVDVGDTTFQLYPHYGFGEPATADGLRALISALAACGR